MKKRTKIELVIFAIVAVLYILGLIRDMPSKPEPVPETTIASVIELPAAPDITETESPENTSAAVTETIQHSGEEESSESEPAESETGTQTPSAAEPEIVPETETSASVEEEKLPEDGEYTDKDRVALYIHTYNRLPVNFITKNEARKKGYKASKQNLWKILDGYCLGGDVFTNREGSLPKKKGRTYYECDINFDGKVRNAERIIYSNDGLIYYTKDHYKTFELLYGEE